jgi:ribosomal protein L37AE/L43A
MRGSSLSSKPGYLVCPLCEANNLHPSGQGSMRCQSCGTHLHGAMLETLRRISALPDALGRHACECDHPEMRLLPDGTYHCPACGSEVLPVDATFTPSIADEHREAYLAGWIDGRFRWRSSFVDNANLARWRDPYDRLDYYRGHRAGSEARQARNSQNPDAHEKLFG